MAAKKKTVLLNLQTMPNDYIKLVNTFFDFSSKEIEIVSELIKQDQTGITKESRKKTVENLSLSGEKLLNTYIKRIKDKGGLKEENGKLTFIGLLIPEEAGITFTW